MKKGFFDGSQLNPFFKANPTARKRYVGLVGCGKSKRTTLSLARDLYTGGFTKIGIEWISRNCERWYILSAHYGLLDPDHVIDPYEKKITDLTDTERAEWKDRVGEGLAAVPGAGRGVKFLVLAGLEYLASLSIPTNCQVMPVFPGGMPMGRRMQWLKKNPVLTDEVLRDIQSREEKTSGN